MVLNKLIDDLLGDPSRVQAMVSYGAFAQVYTAMLVALPTSGLHMQLLQIDCD